MIKTGAESFKGVEVFSIESAKLKAVFTGIGSRMVSLLDKETGRELMVQGRSSKITSGNYDADYSYGDPAGFDEMFPTIDECYYERYPWKGVKMPDHGEIWSLEWGCDMKEDSIEMTVCGVRFPYRFSKKISFRDENVIRIQYSVSNLCQFEMDFLWSAHAMFSMDKESRVLLPKDCRKAVTVYSHDASIGGYGDTFDIREFLGEEDDRYLGIDIGRHSGKYMDKFFIKDKARSGWCGVEHPKDGTAYIMRYPIETVPYLGILLTQGFEIGDCAMLEPCTSAYDRVDRARAFGCYSTLNGGGRYDWHLEIEKVK